MSALVFEHEPDQQRFRLVVDGEEYIIPELDRDHLRHWLHRVGRDTVETLDAIAASDDLVTQITANWDGVIAYIDAVMAYDHTGVLPSRAWVEEHLTSEQLILIVRRIQAAHA